MEGCEAWRRRELGGGLRALIQRVSEASVSVDGEQLATIGAGLLVLLGVAVDDSVADAERLAAKVRALRVFSDDEGRMNEPLGPDREILAISQFTLYGDARRGNRPSWGRAAPGAIAQPLYEHFCELVGAKRGRFGADMQVALVNDGPVTLLLET